MDKINYLISMTKSYNDEVSLFDRYTRRSLDALKALQLIIELDPEKNDAESYRDAVRLILVNGGFV